MAAPTAMGSPGDREANRHGARRATAGDSDDLQPVAPRRECSPANLARKADEVGPGAARCLKNAATPVAIATSLAGVRPGRLDAAPVFAPPRDDPQEYEPHLRRAVELEPEDGANRQR